MLSFPIAAAGRTIAQYLKPAPRTRGSHSLSAHASSFGRSKVLPPVVGHPLDRAETLESVRSPGEELPEFFRRRRGDHLVMHDLELRVVPERDVVVLQEQVALVNRKQLVLTLAEAHSSPPLPRSFCDGGGLGNAGFLALSA